MMEILKPSSKALQAYHDKKASFVSIKPERIFISAWAMREFALTYAMRLVFVIEVGRLYFYVARGDEEGFKITKENCRAGSVRGILLVKTIFARLPAVSHNGPRFNLRVSHTRINDCATFEILIDQRRKGNKEL
jgi:hypothetical protein